MYLRYASLICSLLAGICHADANANLAHEMDCANEWFSKRFTARDFAPPFSFHYGKKHSSNLTKKWPLKRSQRELNNDRREYALTFTDPAAGLIVRCVATEYKDYPAIEWVIYFENPSDKETAILEDIQAADFDIISKSSGDFTLYYAEGSDAKPTDFRPLKKTLPRAANLKLSSYGGRSSEGFLPFFNLADPDGGGVVVAIGWTGQWAASFARNNASSLNIRAGMEHTRLKLYPGEKIRTPAILVLFWQGGDHIRGNNQLRRILRDHYSPTPGGSRCDPPVASSVHGMYGLDGQTTEENVRQFIRATSEHKAPVDCIWVDAGWYSSNPSGKWVYTGTWEADPARFPNGMKPVSDEAHAHGYKFLLWFEPERVMRDSWLHKNRPQWLLAPPQAKDMPAKQQYQAKDGFYLLNLGDPEALAWAKTKFSKMIGDYGVDIYRQDCNIYPLAYWRKGEAADRQGINEIKHVMGLYDFLDTLLRDHPKLIIDNCASGGRRIDFEMLRRSLVLWRSDECWKPVSMQSMTYGLSFWMPLHGGATISLDPYHYRSGMGTNFTIAVNHSDPSLWAPAKKMLNQYRQVKHLFEGDFYPLTDYGVRDDVWMAWEFNRGDLGEGLVQAFRREKSATSKMVFKLKGLDLKARYILKNFDAPNTALLTGEELMNNGLEVSIGSQPGSALFRYRRQGGELRRERKMTFTGLTSGEYQMKFNELTPKGYRPVAIRGYAVGDEARYDLTMEKRSEGKWFARHQCSDSKFRRENKGAERRGFTLAVHSEFRVADRVLHAAVWEMKPVTFHGSNDIPQTGGTAPELAPLDEMLLSFVREQDVPGAAVAIAKNGRLVYARGFGYADVEKKGPVQPDSLFRIASVSKPITAAAVLQLVERGKLKLDDRMVDILKVRAPRGKRRDPRLNKVTLRHLLQHTAGWDRSKSFDPMFRSVQIAKELEVPAPAEPMQIVRYMFGQPLDFEPGQRHAYSNFGYCVLGRVIEEVTGQSYEDYVRGAVLKPLGITRMRIGGTRLAERADGEVRYYTRYPEKGPSVFQSEFGEYVPLQYGSWYLEAMDSHGGWVASAIDLVRFASSLDDSAKTRILSRESVQTMFAPPPAPISRDADGEIDPVYYACGWRVRRIRDGKANTWHIGSLAGTSTLLVRRFDGFCWAVLFNADAASNGKAPAGLIDSLMHRAVNEVRRWPRGHLLDR